MSYEYAVKINPAEMHEKPDNIVTKIMNKIKAIKDRILEKFHVKGDKLEQMADEALVHVAKETITEADKDGIRTEQESADIKEAVETVVVQGALEEASGEVLNAENPIVSLDKDDATAPDLVEAIQDLNEQDATLPTGESVAELAAEVIQRAEEAEVMEESEKPPRLSLSEAITNLVELEQSSEITKRPRAEIICDRNHIESQRIDIIDKRDAGQIELNFKLRGVELNFDNMKTPGGTTVEEDALSYTGVDGKNKIIVAPAYSFERDGIKVTIVDPTTQKMAPKGRVKIEAPADMDPKEIEENVAKILEEELAIPNALEEVPEQYESEFKQSLYQWNHKIDGVLTTDESERAAKTTRKEVYPGYTTYVEEGKHKEYLEKYGEDIRPVHHLHTGTTSSIIRVLTGGVMSSSERYSCGILRSGMSTGVDFETGGADNVFTRLYDKESRGKMLGTTVVFKPELLDRMDWYSYSSDRFGSTRPNVFANRTSPDEILSAVSEKTSASDNEQMFRTGIGPEYIECIEVDPQLREMTLNELRKEGVTEINGRPIEEIVVAREKDPSMMNIFPFWQPSENNSEFGNLSEDDGDHTVELPDNPDLVNLFGDSESPTVELPSFGNPIPPEIKQPNQLVWKPKQEVILPGIPVSFDENVEGQQHYKFENIELDEDKDKIKLDILDGKRTSSAKEIIKLCSGDPDQSIMMGLLAATAKYGDKQKLVNDMKNEIIKDLTDIEIESIATLGLPNNDIGEIIRDISDILGVDFEGYIVQAYNESRKGEVDG